jgi:hypothetical protein
MYGYETWTLTKSDENLLRIFESKILWRFWRIRNNEELNVSINREDIVKFIKAQRIRWLGHVKRMEVGAMPRKMMGGRPHLRWMDDAVTDLKVIKIKQWIEKTKDRLQWRLVVEEAKADPGL